MFQGLLRLLIPILVPLLILGLLASIVAGVRDWDDDPLERGTDKAAKLTLLAIEAVLVVAGVVYLFQFFAYVGANR